MSLRTSRVPIRKMAAEIRAIYTSDRVGAENAIESYLVKELDKFTDDERLELLSEIVAEVDTPRMHSPSSAVEESEILSRVFSLILGDKPALAGLGSGDDLNRLAEALRVIFESLNEIVSVINSTLSGRSGEVETIRHLIGLDLKGNTDAISLKNYLDRIKEAFLTTHLAFRNACRSEMARVLDELDPNRISSESSGGFLGLRRSGEVVEAYRERVERLRHWLDSDQFTEDLSRAFERACTLAFTKGETR